MRATLDQVRTLDLTPALYTYLTAQTSLPADDLLLDLVAQTNALLPEHAHMVVPSEEGALLTLLAQLLSPQLVVEVGTFTGYSSICLARGLAETARLLTFDVSMSGRLSPRSIGSGPGWPTGSNLCSVQPSRRCRPGWTEQRSTSSSSTLTSPVTSTTGT